MDTKTTFMCCLQETHFLNRDTKAENERVERDILHKWKPKWNPKSS